MEHPDIILRNGHVVDPASAFYGKADVAIHQGRITAIGNLEHVCAIKSIDVSGLYVTPGLVDLHAHAYSPLTPGADCLPCYPLDVSALTNGVTTLVDAGTCGASNFSDFYERVIKHSKVRIFALVNVADYGMTKLTEEGNGASLNPVHVAETVHNYSGTIVGVKSAHYRPSGPFSELRPAWASVDAALEAGSLTGLPAMMDVVPILPDRSYPDLLARMRPGDIHAHVFAPHIPSLDSMNQVGSWMWAARERGVLFDLAHGVKSFSFACAAPAIEQGFYPDSISTDLYFSSALGPSVSLPHVMGKCLAMGMPLKEIVARTTWMPSRMLNLPDSGALKVGNRADIAVFKIVTESIGFTDADNNRINANQYFSCRMTILAGEVVFNPFGLGCEAFDQYRACKS